MGVAIGITGNEAFGTSPAAESGRGVTIAMLPLGRTASVASVRAGISDPGLRTKFLPCRKI